MKKLLLFSLVILFIFSGLFLIPETTHAAYVTTFLNTPLSGTYAPGSTITISGIVRATTCSNEIFQVPVRVYLGGVYTDTFPMTVVGGSDNNFSHTITLPSASCGAKNLNVSWDVKIYTKGSTSIDFTLLETDSANYNVPITIGNPSVCGTSNGGSSPTKPTSGLCATGSTASTVNGSGPWTWTCGTFGNCGSIVNCSTSVQGKGSCGTNAKLWNAGSTSFTGTFCSTVGEPTPAVADLAFPTADNPSVIWTCPGVGGGATSDTCTATLKVDGVCGPISMIYNRGYNFFNFI